MENLPSHKTLYGTHHYPTSTPPYQRGPLPIYDHSSLGKNPIGYFGHCTTFMSTFGPSHSTSARMNVPTTPYDVKPMYDPQN